MKEKKTLIAVAGILLIAFLPVLALANAKGMEGVDKEALMKKVSGLQMPFIENQGQIKDKSVRFYANTFAGTVYVTDKCEIVYSLQKTEQGTESMEQRQKIDGFRDQERVSKAIAIKESLQCAELTEIKGTDRSATKANYFIGSKDNWRTGIPTWKGVSLGKVYKGIELNLRVYGNNVEKLFTVYPEGKVSDIKVKTEGAKGIKVNKAGELEIETGLGTVKMTKPVAYQEIKGKRVQVAANYTISEQSGKTYGFRVGEYDRTRPLVIDPLLASTFVGGSSVDRAYALAIDSSGNVIVAGYSYSTDYPTTDGAYDTTHNGIRDAMISILDSDLTSLLSSTFIGGSVSYTATALAIDLTGNVFVAGYTWSSGDVFISKLDSDLTSLLASTVIKGRYADRAYALAIDSSGNVYIAGYTKSADYPVTEGAYDTTFNGYYDVFISKLDNDLTSLLSSTFIGESSYEEAYAIAIDLSGNVIIAGATNSTDYPTTEGAYDTTLDGYDVIISKLDSNLSTLLSSTFVGGSGGDYGEEARALAIDSSGNVIITGKTSSPDYPITEGAYDTTFGDSSFIYAVSDAFISKLDSDLSSLLASTFIGGSSSDYAEALAIDSSGNVLVAGSTRSPDYPVTEGAYDTTPNDAFISKLDSDLSSLLASTLIGGSNIDSPYALAIDLSGNVFVAGWTRSTDYPVTEGAYDTTCGDCRTYGDYGDVFISKLDSNLSGDIIVPVPDIKANDSDGPITITHHDTLSITISLSPGSYDGEDADWWILMETPSGWYHYNFDTERWKRGIGVSYQGPLYEIDSEELWVRPSKRKGEYRYYFKVDTDMNGEMDEDQLYEDSVVVEVTKR